MADAQSPLFSENAKAAFLSNINDQSGNAVNAISQNLARRGALNSGALGSAFTDVELSRNRDITDFLTQLPLLERNAKFNALTPLLQLGLGFAGTGPQDVTSTRTGTTTSDTQSTGNVNVNGPGFLRSLAQEAGSASALGNSNSLLNLLLSGRFGGGNNVDPVGQALNYDPRNPAIDPNNPLAAVLGLGRS